MSSNLAIAARGVGKSYRLRSPESSSTLLYEAILSRIRHPLQKNSSEEEFWALRDLDFTIEQGEAVGILGRNGAGKSTLLKILSRITEPTSGEILMYGRVQSLLEVGTGFHPELTGRENVFLNGSILGMKRREILRRFDEIVQFAEVERFLDTPVKRYSSGMYVRLAFSVAAHLDPQILIVDEVLSVGDADFQKKCLGKMEDVSATDGRTVLFVSHNTAAVEALCSRGIYLHKGTIAYDGSAQEALNRYLLPLNVTGGTAGVYDVRSLVPDSEPIIFQSLSIVDAEGNPCSSVTTGAAASIRVLMDKVDLLPPAASLVIQVHSRTGQLVLQAVSSAECVRFGGLRDGDSALVSCTFPYVPLVPGPYSISIAIHDGTPHGWVNAIPTAAKFAIVPASDSPSVTLHEAQPVVVVDPDWDLAWSPDQQVTR